MNARSEAIVCLAVMLACCTSVFALDPSLDITQYAHTAWKVRDGFAKGFIYSIAQTPDGYLWLGTEFGLLRFDGVRTVAWKPPTGQLPSNDIPTLLVTRGGTLWIGTAKGLGSWRDGKLTTYAELNGSRISVLLEDHEGTVWIATREPRIFGEKVGPIYADSEGNFWVGFEEGSRKWKSGRPESFEILGAGYVQPAFGTYEKSALLIGSDGEVRGFFDGQVQGFPSTGVLQRFKTSRIVRDRDGGLWIATRDRGLVHLHEGKTDVFSEVDGLSGDTVTALLQDQEGDIWAVTTNGIDRFREYAIPNVSIKQGLSNTNTVSILGAKDGSVWVATYTGLNRWKNGRISVLGRAGTTQNPKGTPKGLPYSLFQDSGGRIWLSTALEFGYLENDRFVPVRDVAGGRVTSLAEVPSGHLWLAKEEYGLLHLFQGRVVERIPWASLGHRDHASVLVVDPSQDGLWLGFSGGGISYFAAGGIRKSYSVAEGLGAGRVNGLRFDQRGGLWIATESGLSRIKNGKVTTLTSKNGLPCNTVHWSMDDADHFVWVYTACGLVRIARPELDAWVDDPARSVQGTLFDVSDGVRTRSYPSSVYGVTKASDRRIWYVASDGVSVIDPRHFPFNNLPPPVHIEQITADDKTYDATSGLRLPPHVRNLDIDYTALSLVVPEKVRFRVKLEGQDKDWRELLNVRHVEYTNLSPKHYRFRVLASNNSGLWNEEGASLDFVIPPAWYQTNWFRVACVAAFALSLWAVYQLRVRGLAHQFDMRLEERVNERTRIARELHDTLLQSFQALLPTLQVAIYELPESAVEARKTLKVAVDQAAEAIIEGRDAVQGLRMSTVEQNDLALAIRTVGEELASGDNNQSSPEFNVVVEGTSRNLHPILRDEVYRLAAEALRNTFRHAAAQTVEVEIRYGEKHFRLRVRDDGKGIRDEILRSEGREGHYGLHGMKERAELVGGQLTIWSEVDNGTEIELYIPASRAYAQPIRRFWNFGKRSPEEVEANETIKRE
jgi:signal transduction histidine kinase/ligand-binding sensor domain-containing protein